MADSGLILPLDSRAVYSEESEREKVNVPTIVVTGGCGFIGSHVVAELAKEYGVNGDADFVCDAARDRFRILVVDNLSTGSKEAIDRISKKLKVEIAFEQLDLTTDAEALSFAIGLRYKPVIAVIHLAGKKSVPESLADPLSYYTNNVVGTLVLLSVMKRCNVYNLVFSSSATVYAPKQTNSNNRSSDNLSERDVCQPNNVYGETKKINEDILQNLCLSDPRWRVTVLRYFNPVGADLDLDIGEDAFAGTGSSNLIPCLVRVALGKTPRFIVYGSDYDTPDGTAVRDYVHVKDLARGHVKALERQLASDAKTSPISNLPADQSFRGVAPINNHVTNFQIYNLGTGVGTSVDEMVSTFKRACNREFPVSYTKARDGDVARSVASIEKANRDLQWKCDYTLYDMCKDAWEWQLKNPNGYRKLGQDESSSFTTENTNDKNNTDR